MGVIKIMSSAVRSPANNYSGFREKLGKYQCNACHRIHNEHTNEELDKCMDDMFPLRKLVREQQEIEFNIPEKEYSPEQLDALAQGITDQVMQQSKSKGRKIAAELKAYLEKCNQS